MESGQSMFLHLSQWKVLKGMALLFMCSGEHGQFTDTLHQNAARASGACAGSPLLSIIQLVAGVRFELTTFGL